MNAERINQVADAIEQHTIPWLGFNMQGYIHMAGEETPDMSFHNCGTVACIAGWTMAIKHGEAVLQALRDEDGTLDATDVAGENVDDGAKEWLGLDEKQRTFLFYKWDATAEEAVRTLRHLALTGVVDWTV